MKFMISVKIRSDIVSIHYTCSMENHYNNLFTMSLLISSDIISLFLVILCSLLQQQNLHSNIELSSFSLHSTTSFVVIDVVCAFPTFLLTYLL